ncbi:MAG: hypothetical protein PHQ35_05045 [Phycisphaerae bacterium]|nr:hypothetical protein [Phycisphaerae bacterium]MDD5380917.1 hypothetical protein [Phycisphaerae bacterium]
MITKKTVLVLGAGASAPFGFPTGQGLKDKICYLLDTGATIKELTKLKFTPDEINNFRQALIKSPLFSVDAFLERRSEFERVGKAAIAAALLPCEKTHGLFDDWIEKRKKENSKDSNEKEGNWYDQLFNALNTEFDKLNQNKLSIITFNYDRSLEQYLFTGLRNTYGRTSIECEEKLSEIRILHIYGSIGHLLWNRPDDLSVEYDSCDSIATAKPIGIAMKNIKIIPENKNVEEIEEFKEARQLLRSAERIYFLGFGYHPMNLERLGVKWLTRQNGQDIQGTSLGLSVGTRELVNRLTYSVANAPARLFCALRDCTVWRFFHDYVSLKDV